MTRDRRIWIGAALPLLLLAACGGEPTEADAGAAASTPAPAGGTATASEAAPVASLAPASALPSPTPSSAAAPKKADGSIAAYVGKWPFDEVDGVKWNDNPVVLAGIRKSVTDPAARKAILELPGPSAAIELVDGKVSAWACQAHNCGDHQWMVMVDPASGATDVCYHNAKLTPGEARWFLASGKQELRTGDCNPEKEPA